MAGLLNLVTQWLVRSLVILSLVAHLFLIFFAGVRRREASGWRRVILWLANQAAELAATQTLGNLFLGSTSREQQLVAFWLPFLLIHLARPDNIGAYSIEDSVLSLRTVLAAILQILSSGYVLYKHIIYVGHDGTFLAASVLMFVVGIVKYGESVYALWQGKLDSIQSSGKEEKPESISPARLDWGGNEKALLAAHRVFNITKGAFADYSAVDEDPLRPYAENRGSWWTRGWDELWRLVELELSLMYDLLYTKAATICTWHGYCIRFTSLHFIAIASWLFWLSSKDGQRWADVCITYLLLLVTFFLEVRWLLRALGSTWTYAYLIHTELFGLHHVALCSGRWRRLRHFVVSLDLCRIVLSRPPISYRMWSGRIGQYNLLHECTHKTSTGLFWSVAESTGLENSWKEYKYHYSGGINISPSVKNKLFEMIWDKLKLAYRDPRMHPLYAAPAPPPHPPDLELRRRRKLDKALGFGAELQENILVWHLATDILLHSDLHAVNCTFLKTIEVVSNYIMFLAAVRPYMIQGLNLNSMCKSTSKALKSIWYGDKEKKYGTSNSLTREWKLASTLKMMDKKLLYEKSIILSDGVELAKKYLQENGPDGALVKILDNWVLMLIYVSTRCSRDSHAKQLGNGGELTTIVWILAEHAGVFGISEPNRQHYLESIVDNVPYKSFP